MKMIPTGMKKNPTHYLQKSGAMAEFEKPNDSFPSQQTDDIFFVNEEGSFTDS